MIILKNAIPPPPTNTQDPPSPPAKYAQKFILCEDAFLTSSFYYHPFLLPSSVIINYRLSFAAVSNFCLLFHIIEKVFGCILSTPLSPKTACLFNIQCSHALKLPDNKNDNLNTDHRNFWG